MIDRIVRLSFFEGNIDKFLKIFEESKEQIASFPGCNQLKLMQDVDQKQVFYTYSKWDSASDLENYRNSELFKHTWAKTKALFNEKPMAFSTKMLQSVK